MRKLQPFSFSLLLFSAAVPAIAGVVEGNLDLSFQERASLGSDINAIVQLDPGGAAQRLVNDRLGTWTGTSVQLLNVQHRVAVAVNDPGVAVAPTENRPLINVNTTATLKGALIGDASVTSTVNGAWYCPAGATACNILASPYTRTLTAPQLGLTAPEQALGTLDVGAKAAEFTVLFEDVTPRLGAVPPPPNALLNFTESYHELQGTIRLRATYETKSIEDYMADALEATQDPALGWSEWLAAATDDVTQLRAGDYTDVAVLSGNQRVADVNELRNANALLATASDAATWEALGATPGGSLETRSDPMAQLWNLTASAEPSLGRGLAGYGSEPAYVDDPILDLAALRAALDSDDDMDFLADFARYTGADRPVGSSDPWFTLDGDAFGLADALLQVFFTEGNRSDGLFQINLPSATHHALWHPSSSFDSISLLGGPGFRDDDWGEVSTVDDSLYVGENQHLLDLSVLQPFNALQLGLNNFYSSGTVVVASWGVTTPENPVPLPSTLLLLSGALPGLGLIARVRSQRDRRGSAKSTAGCKGQAQEGKVAPFNVALSARARR
jgi:hypothetical protein